MKVRDRIDVITDLFLGALYADKQFTVEENSAVRRLLCDLLLCDRLPAPIEARIVDFDPRRFDLRAAARDFASDPPMKKRRLLELVGQLCLADGVLDFDEDAYLVDLAAALGMERSEYADLALDYEVAELRNSLADIRMTPHPKPPSEPPPLPPPRGGHRTRASAPEGR